MLEPVELEFRIKDADLEQGSQRVVERIVNMDDEAKQLIQRLEALEAKFRELSGQTVMPGVAEQMADIRGEISQLGGALGQMVDGAVTGRINEVTDGMQQVAEAGETATGSVLSFMDGVQAGLHNTLEGMKAMRSDLLSLGEDSGSGLMQRIDSEIEEIEKKLAGAASASKDAAGVISEGFDDVAQSGEKATKMVGMFSSKLVGGLYMVAAQAVIGLAVAIYKLATELTDLEKAIMRVDRGFVEFYGNLNNERASLDDQFNKLRNAKEGTVAYESAKESIMNQYGKYLKGLSDEVQSLRDVEGSYKAVSAAVIQLARDRAMATGKEEAIKTYSEIEGKNLNIIMEAFKKTSPEHYKKLVDELKQSIDSGTELTEDVQREIEKFTAKKHAIQTESGELSYGGNRLKKALNEIYDARTVMEDERRRVIELYSAPPDTTVAKQNFDYWSRELKRLEESRRDLSSDEVGGDKWQELTKEIKAARMEVEKYSDAKVASDRRPDRSDERMFGKEQQRLQRITDLQRRIREQEVSGELDTQEAIIATMDEGIEKELAQIALNYERRMTEVAKWGDELIRQQQEIERALWEKENPDWEKKKLTFTPKTTMVTQLSSTQQTQIADREFLAEEEMNRATREALQKRLADYQSFENKQKDIQKKYTDLRLALDRKYGNDRGAAYQEALDNMRRGEQDESEQLLRQNVEATDAFRRLNMVIEQEGRAALRERIRRLEEYLRVVAEKAGKESELYKQAYQEVKAARRELDQDTLESYKHVAGIFQMIAKNMSDTGNVFSKVAAEIAQSAIQIYEASKSDNTAGQVTGIISGILSITAAFRDWRYETMEIYDPLRDKAEVYDQIANSVEATNMRLAHQKSLLSDLTGVEAVEGKISLIDSLTKKQEDAMKKLNELNVQFINSQEEVFKDSDNKFMRVLGGIFAPGGLIANIFSPNKLKATGANRVGNFLTTGGQMQTEIVYEFKSLDTSGFQDIEDYRDLLIEIKENGGKIYGKEVVESDIKALEELINAYDEAVAEAKSLMKELEQMFTDTTADAISQSIAEGFMSGKRSMQDFTDDFETLMKNAIKASFRINVTDMLAKDFYQKFAEATQSDFILTAEEISSLKDDFQQRIADASDQWKMFEDILAQAGIDISDAASQKKEVGGFQTMSQETGSFLLGQFTAFRIHASNIDDKISNMFLDYSVITGQLAAIAQNTANTVVELKGWRGDFKRAKDEGFKIV